MPETRRSPDGSLIEIPPAILDCGHPFRGNVTVGYQPDSHGVRRRSYYCRACRTTTWG